MHDTKYFFFADHFFIFVFVTKCGKESELLESSENFVMISSPPLLACLS